LIRHAHATMRVSAALEAFPDSSERQRAAVEAVQVAMGWASSETTRRYVHAISTAEAQELVQRRFIDRLAAHARDLPSAMARTRSTKLANSQPHGVADDHITLDLDTDAQRTIAWIASLGGPDQ
jgi:hypothetical protein